MEYVINIKDEINRSTADFIESEIKKAKDGGYRNLTFIINSFGGSVYDGLSIVSTIKNSGMSWPHLEDLDGISKSIFGPGVPVTWFFDEAGNNVGTKIGAYTNKKQLFEQVEKAFGIKL